MRFEPQGFRSGKIYEINLFGEAGRDDAEYNTALERVKRPSRDSRFEYYVDFPDAMALVRNFQPIDKTDPEKKRFSPVNPQKPFAKDLRVELIEFLGFSDEEAETAVKVFTAVGTPLDAFHGVDAVIEIEGIPITFDATLRTELQKGMGKADVIDYEEIPNADDPEEEEAYFARVAEIAKKIAAQYTKKKKIGTEKATKPTQPPKKGNVLVWRNPEPPRG